MKALLLVLLGVVLGIAAVIGCVFWLASISDGRSRRSD